MAHPTLTFVLAKQQEVQTPILFLSQRVSVHPRWRLVFKRRQIELELERESRVEIMGRQDDCLGLISGVLTHTLIRGGRALTYLLGLKSTKLAA